MKIKCYNNKIKYKNNLENNKIFLTIQTMHLII